MSEGEVRVDETLFCVSSRGKGLLLNPLIPTRVLLLNRPQSRCHRFGKNLEFLNIEQIYLKGLYFLSNYNKEHFGFILPFPPVVLKGLFIKKFSIIVLS